MAVVRCDEDKTLYYYFNKNFEWAMAGLSNRKLRWLTSETDRRKSSGLQATLLLARLSWVITWPPEVGPTSTVTKDLTCLRTQTTLSKRLWLHIGLLCNLD